MIAFDNRFDYSLVSKLHKIACAVQISQIYLNDI